MQKYIAFILIFFGFANAYSQDKAEQISEGGLIYLTQFYHNQSNWEAMLKLEPSIIASKSKQATLYSRLGEAFYYTYNFNSAEKYLKEAYKLSPNDEIIYLYYYSIYFQGNILEANQLKNKMKPSMVQKIENYTPISIFETIYIEGGVKVLKEKEIGGNLYYASLFSAWNLANNLKMNLGFNYLMQEIFNANYTQPELYLSTSFAIGKGWSFTPAFHGLINNNKVNDLTHTTEKSNILFVQGNLTKRIYNLTLETSYGQHFDQTTIKDKYYQTIITEFTSQFGISLFYKFDINKSIKYILNPNYYYLSKTSKNIQTTGMALNISNSLFYDKWQIYASYLKKGNLLFADNSGAYYYNILGQIKNRYSITVGKTINQNLDVFITYQKEQQFINQTDNLNYNSLFLSLKFKL